MMATINLFQEGDEEVYRGYVLYLQVEELTYKLFAFILGYLVLLEWRCLYRKQNGISTQVFDSIFYHVILFR